MLAAQLGLNTVSDNVANLNTPGYVDKIVQLNSQAIAGVAGFGVRLGGAGANQFLQNASLAATASSSQASIVSSLLTQAQSYFGDPSSSTSYFNLLNQSSSDFGFASSNDPASPPFRAFRWSTTSISSSASPRMSPPRWMVCPPRPTARSTAISARSISSCPRSPG